VQFLWRRQPVAIRPEQHGRLLLDTVQVQQVDDNLFPIPESQFTIVCDMIVPAIGQSPLTQIIQDKRRIEIQNGRVIADPVTGQTGNPRYFAGGDCVNGGREVVDAVADGKRAALAMMKAAEACYA
jgi:dihydropyrimidine dehydrogenase (NAD+) subunit PreT